MTDTFKTRLDEISQAGNLRSIPAEQHTVAVDFTSNDYLGLGGRSDLRDAFFAQNNPAELLMTSSASRLLARPQKDYASLESCLEKAYGRSALTLNSGYHANSGIIPALCLPGTVIIADRLVHASIIDGIRLSGAQFERFRHNDHGHLVRLLEKHKDAPSVLIIVESVYSMDGDSPDMDELAAIRRRHPNALLYIDEAHAMGVCGDAGLGMAHNYPEADIIIGTFGKALASCGAFALCSDTIKRWLINRCRSFIFSTSLPPIMARWSEFIFRHAMDMESERRHLRHLASLLDGRYIYPHIVGDPHKALSLSDRLSRQGIAVLPIRHPTVPQGTERLRISLSAAHKESDVRRLISLLANE